MIKSKLEFRVGNRRVSQRDFLKNIEQTIVQKAAESIQKKVKSVVDPVTGKSAKVTVSPTNALEMVVEGPKDLVERVKVKLK
jgi:hypothetical protein